MSMPKKKSDRVGRSDCWKDWGLLCLESDFTVGGWPHNPPRLLWLAKYPVAWRTHCRPIRDSAHRSTDGRAGNRTQLMRSQTSMNRQDGYDPR